MTTSGELGMKATGAVLWAVCVPALAKGPAPQDGGSWPGGLWKDMEATAEVALPPGTGWLPWSSGAPASVGHALSSSGYMRERSETFKYVSQKVLLN